MSLRRVTWTKRKDDENFVVNSIWNKVNNIELKPVTQQYVNCGDSWYLIDLFFPQINLGIEVDEQGHINQVDRDSLRSDQIVSAMKYENRNDFEIKRIKTHSNNIHDVVVQIEEVVGGIKQKIDKLEFPLHWMIREEIIDTIRRKARLTIYDDISFGSITQTINELFDWGRRASGGPSRVCFKYKHDPNLYLWFAHRNVFKKDKEIAQAHWINRLSRNGKEIIEFKDDSEEVMVLPSDPKSYEESTEDIRITFLKYRNNLGENGYKFVGIFRKVGWIITKFNGKNVKAAKYTLMQNWIDLP
jgi:very-short-patch-repair endonuclease